MSFLQFHQPHLEWFERHSNSGRSADHANAERRPQEVTPTTDLKKISGHTGDEVACENRIRAQVATHTITTPEVPRPLTGDWLQERSSWKIMWTGTEGDLWLTHVLTNLHSSMPRRPGSTVQYRRLRQWWRLRNAGTVIPTETRQSPDTMPHSSVWALHHFLTRHLWTSPIIKRSKKS